MNGCFRIGYIKVMTGTRAKPTTRTIAALVHPQYPGLAIHPAALAGQGGWRITHIPSGLEICRTNREKQAKEALPRLAKLADWTQDAETLAGTLTKLRELISAVKAALNT